mgnify:FL=1
MKEIAITEIEQIRIGNAQNREAATGCTVILCEEGAAAGVDVRGGGPASRETQLLNPLAAADKIHAVLLSGGSAFGLDAAGGVMKYLEERGVGVDTGVAKVPLVCTSCLFDLQIGSKDIRPDREMGYLACSGDYRDGNYGAGTGATVGKFKGTEFMMKTGIGSFALQEGPLKIGAIAAVNALGDVFDYQTGEQIAGLLNEEKNGLRSTENEMYRQCLEVRDLFTGNTTLGASITNADFDKAQMNKIAAMAQNGYARSIRPVHTQADGDTVYALSTGEVTADLNAVGTLAAQVMAEAIRSAVFSAESAYGLPCAADFMKKGTV